MTDEQLLNNLEQMRRTWTASGADHDIIRQTLAEIRAKLQRLAELEAKLEEDGGPEQEDPEV